MTLEKGRAFMKTMFLIVVCAFALLSPRAYGVDISVNVQEISHVTSEEIGGLCDVWGWYDSQNDKYYALACNAGDTSRPLGLKIVDATDPENPSLIGTAAYGQNPTAMDIKVVGDYAYVADDSSGLQVINVANPANPVYAGSYDTPGYALGVFVLGNYAYVADDYSGLQVINVANPANPVYAGSYDTPGYASAFLSWAITFISEMGLRL